MTAYKKYSFYFLPFERLCEPFILKAETGNYALVMIFIYRDVLFAEIKLIFALRSIYSNVLTSQIWKAMMLICVFQGWLAFQIKFEWFLTTIIQFQLKISIFAYVSCACSTFICIQISKCENKQSHIRNTMGLLHVEFVYKFWNFGKLKLKCLNGSHSHINFWLFKDAYFWRYEISYLHITWNHEHHQENVP